MKIALIFSVISLFALPSFALQEIIETPIIATLLDEREHFVKDVRFEYNFNEELGRAWITAHINDSALGTEEVNLSEERIVFVKSLKFDPATKNIVHVDAKHGDTVCATVEHVQRRFFTRLRVNETQKCVVTHRKEKRVFDLGTYIVTRAYDVWELKLNP